MSYPEDPSADSDFVLKFAQTANSLYQQREQVNSIKKTISNELHIADQAMRLADRMNSSPASKGTIYLPSRFMWSLVERFELQMLETRRYLAEMDSFLNTSGSGTEMITPHQLKAQMDIQNQRVHKITQRVEKLKRKTEAAKKLYITQQFQINPNFDPSSVFDIASSNQKDDPLLAIIEGASTDPSAQPFTESQLYQFALVLNVTPQDLNLLGPSALPPLPITPKHIQALEKARDDLSAASGSNSGSSWSSSSGNNTDTSNSGSSWSSSSGNNTDTSNSGWSSSSTTNDQSGTSRGEKARDDLSAASGSNSGSSWSSSSGNNTDTSNSGWSSSSTTNDQSGTSGGGWSAN